MLFEILIGIFLVAAVILFFLYVFPMCTMHPLASGKIEGTDIITVKNRINNLFFIPQGRDWIVIDAGSDAGAVKREMKRMSIDGDRVKAVFLTHTDYDHVASIVLFPNAAIYMNEQEKQMIDGSTYRQIFKKNRLPQLSDSNKIVYLSEYKMIEAVTNWSGGGVDETHGHQQDALCKHQVRMIPAPGHTKGSAMYVVDEKYLFTGDAFKTAGGRILLHPYTMDRKQAKETLHRIKEELNKYEKVFTAHYGLVESDSHSRKADIEK
ncbi:MAG: MBL fold metallo-hydrolase [Lachnospiraceae bacterium]|nr:MBL fold metallo-hydrolase [Lachnospiraceae bacterium]